MRVIKRVITIIADSFLMLICCMMIVCCFCLPATKDQIGLYGERVLTLKQSITIINSNDEDVSVTLEKGSEVSADIILERGVLYTEDINGVHFHEYIPLEFFVEAEELQAELNVVAENARSVKMEKMQAGIVWAVLFSVVYLLMAVPASIVAIKKGRFLASFLINVILALIVIILCYSSIGY